MNIIKPWSLFLALLLAFFPWSVQSQVRGSDQMRELIDKFQFEQAYDLAQGKLMERDDEYLLWSGIAAQGVGRLAESQERLEEFIRKQPAHTQLPRARLELALTLLLLGEMRGADAQLDKLLQANPPPNVLAKIQFLRNLAAQATPWQSAGQFEVGAGHDSNANAGVTSASLVLPTLGAVTINSSGLKTPAAFQSISGLASVAYRINSQFSAFGVGSAEYKAFQGHSELDQLNATAGVGGLWQKNTNKLRLLQLWQQLQLDGNKYRDVNTTNMEWTHDVNGNSRFIFVGSAGTMAYGAANSMRDANLSTYAVDYVHTFRLEKSPVAVLGLSDSREKSSVGRPEFGRRITATKMGFSIEPWPGGSSGLQWTKQDIQHDGLDPLYGTTRADRYNIQSIYVGHKYNPKVSLLLDLQRLRNVSNIEIWSHDRVIGSLKIRINF
jgi:tetratricopeptide (TPR) repeat protein